MIYSIYFLLLVRISPVFGCCRHRSTIRARRACRARCSGSSTPSGFRCTLVDCRPIAPVARGPCGCRPSGSVRTSGCRPPGSRPPGIARPLSRPLLIFDLANVIYRYLLTHNSA